MVTLKFIDFTLLENGCWFASFTDANDQTEQVGELTKFKNESTYTYCLTTVDGREFNWNDGDPVSDEVQLHLTFIKNRLQEFRL